MAIPKKLLEEILADDFYQKCIRSHEGTCRGRVTFEHAIIYAGKQVQEKWAIVPLCEYHHDVLSFQDRGDLKKDYGQWVALNRMTEADEKKYPKRNWKKERELLNKKYGKER